MGDEHTGPLGAGSEPTSGSPPRLPHAPATDVTRATAPGAPLTSDIRPPTSVIPTRIGRYTITRVLGEGGMGTVYEAQQESPKRTVALKVIRAGYLSPELLRRFTQESQVLGRLQHPGIAQVYEAGVARDERGHELPFFAMEFIKGVPLTEYVNQKRLGTRDRLELLAKVCDAVYHAHQKGVIHRDLKPGNIIVDESGQPKILDFGIARATDSDIQQTTLQTDIGQLIGTIPYMSPEQVGGDPNDLDTRSDVYALGVIAYELLAGRLPYDLQRKMIHEAARIIKEEEPTRLSSINRTLRGDVETIVAKALEKDKVRRYQSAESFASDIRRYLKHEPIAARPASTWYQLQKFSRRNTGLVAGLAAAFALLIAGLIGTSYGLREAVVARDNERAARTEADAQRDAAVKAREAEEAQRKAAEAQRDKAEKIAEFMSDTLKGAGPSVALGRDITMLREMMDAAAARIENGDLKDAPEAELRLRSSVGNTYRELAAYDGSQRMLEPAVALAGTLHPGDHPELATAIHNVALLLHARGDLAAAEPLFRRSLEMRKRLFPGNHPDVAIGLNNLAILLKDRGDIARAEALCRESLAMTRHLFPGDHPDLAIGLNNLARLLQERGALEEAESLFREVLEMKRRLFPGDHPDVAIGLNNLSRVLQARGDLARSELLCRESLEMTKRLFAGDHPDVARTMNNLASLLKTRGDLDGAEPLYREAIDMWRRLFPGDHPNVANGLNNLARVLQSRGDIAGAEPLCRESLEMRKRLFPGDHQSVAIGLNNLADLLQDRDDLAGAEALYREAIDMWRRLYRGDHPNLASGLNNLASLLQDRHDLAGAEPLFRESLEMQRRLFPGDHPDIANSLGNLGSVLRARGDVTGAESLYREAIGICQRTLSQDYWLTGNVHLGLGRTLTSLNRFVEAETELVEAVRALEMLQSVPPGRYELSIEAFVELYELWDKAEPGKGYDVKAAEWKAKLDAVTPPEAEPKPDEKK